MKKRFLTFLLAIAAVVSCAFGFSACDEQHGTAGVVYEVVDGEASVVGYDGTETDVRIAKTYGGVPVTSIGECAFMDCSSLTSVEIPDSITSINEGAFGYCSSLTSVEIPGGVTSIGPGAFAGCSNLTNITVSKSNTAYQSIDGNLYSKAGETLIQYAMGKTATSVAIPDGVISIGGGAFALDTNITSVEIPDSVTSIGYAAFSGCSSLTEIVIPDSVRSIGTYAFDNCYSLTSVEIGDSVTSIGDYAFYSCYILTSVKIPDSVTSIGESAFSRCDSLTSVEIGDGVTSIGDYAFYYCRSLTSVYITDIAAWCNISGLSNLMRYGSGSKKLYLNNEPITELVIPDGVTSIGNYTFYNCSSLASVVIPDSVTSIGEDAFEDCSSLTGVYITDIAAWCNISFGNSYANPLWYAKNLYLNNQPVTELLIPDGVTSIGASAFAGCDSLTSVVIPDSVTSIGSSAFYECSSLTSVVIPDSVTSIGDYAFLGCSSLTSVYITDIAAWCKISFVNSANPLNSSNLYLNNELVTELVIPNSATFIGDYAFSGCRSLTSVVIPDSVTGIGEWAFAYCDNLTSVVIGDSVTSIGEYAFYDCSSLTIYCEAESRPIRWNYYWNFSNRPVVWGYNKSLEITIPEALALAEAQGQNVLTESKYYITGTVITISNTKYGNMYIQDAEGNKIYVYGCYTVDGVRYDAMENPPQVGDTVKLYSALTSYNGEGQLKNASVIQCTAAQ